MTPRPLFHRFLRQWATLPFFLAVGGIVFFSSPTHSQDYRLTDVPAEESLLKGAVEPEPVFNDGLFEFNQRRWNQARESIEREEHPFPEASAPTLPDTPKNETSGINVDLPYDSGLSISGRKLIALRLSQTRRKSAKRSEDLGLDQNTNDMEMRQELQVRIKGKVGRKITVNVDFDDTKEDKRDISVMYQGDPGEFVQEAAFGDITLSLPSTEFVSFSKQLFGVRTKLQYKNATLLAIGSRAKGTTETKRFNGATKFERRVIPGHNYVKKQYYSVAFTTRPIVAGTAIVWRDDGIVTNNNITTVDMTGEDFTVSAARYSGKFDLLKPGDDYTLDAARGILLMKQPAAANDVLIIDYQFADDGSWLRNQNTPGLLKVIKTVSDSSLSIDPLETAHRREIKTFYRFGNIRLIPDNGSGNFILRTVDGNQNEKVIPLKPSGDLVYKSSDVVQGASTVEVDFDTGVFNIKFATGTFDPENYLRVNDAAVYAPSPTSEFSFLTEYKYRLRDFQLRPNVVFGSERVTVNGRLMKSEIDYFLDSGSGLLQFFNEYELDENSQIEVTYDYAPFGGQLGQTLVGTRAELALIPGKLEFGSTFLYTFAPKTTVVPDVRSTPSSLMVLEADGRIMDVEIPFTDLKMSFTGEAAQSRENPNLYGKALVDSMEGVAQEDTVILDPDFWFLGSNPTDYGIPTNPNSLAAKEVTLNLRDVVSAQSGVNDNEQLRVLEVAVKNLYQKPGDPSRREKSSLIQSLPKGGGQDYSKKMYMELWLEGFGSAGQGVDLEVNAGIFNEDADLDGVEDTEDVNKDGTLNINEDVGYSFRSWGADGIPNNADDVLTSIGANNGRIDSENANGGGFLTVDKPDFSTSLLQLSHLPSGTTVTDRNGISSPISDLGFTGWRFIRVPLSGITSNPDKYNSVEHVRLTFHAQTNTSPATTKVRIGKISFVGNTWEKPVLSHGAEMTVAAVNNLSNPDYDPLIGHPAFNDLYGDQAENRTREQALELKFTLLPGSTATTRSLFSPPRDFSHHKSLDFFFQRPLGQPAGETLFVQFGSDSDYFEFSRPIGNDTVGWVQESIRLLDQNNDGTPETIFSDTPGSSVRVVGSPNLSRLGQFKIGVRNDTLTTIESTLWVNEIHVSGARTRIGNARRFTADGRWGGWGSFGGGFRNVDRNFQTLTSPVVNQDRESYNGYATFSKLRFMPLSGSYSHSKTITPAVLQTGQSQLVSVLSEGREENTQFRGDGQFLFSNFPALSYSAERTLTESTTNKDKRDNNVYSGSLDYAVPVQPDILPGKLMFKPLPESVFLKYTRANFIHSFFPERLEEQLNISTDPVTQSNAVFSNARVSEFSDDWVGRLAFRPWTGLVFTPNYSQRTVTERRDYSPEELERNPQFIETQSYEKSFSQTRGLAGSWRIFPWLEPRMTFSQTGTETNGLPTASSPTASNLKNLERTAAGDLFLSLAPRDLFPKLSVFRSLNMDASFRVDSSDSYGGVPKGYTDWQKITLFQVAKVDRRDGSKMFGLLSPLEFEDSTVERRQVTARNTLRYALNWSPLDWIKFPYRLEPFKTMSLNNTLTITNEHTENTLTARDVTSRTSPDLIVTLRDTEKLFFTERWVGGSQVNYRYTQRTAETFKEDTSDNLTQGLDYRLTFIKRYDIFMSMSKTKGETTDLRTGLLKSSLDGFNHTLQVGTKLGRWRLTPSGGIRSDVSKDGTGRLLQDIQVQSASVLGRFDKSYPGGFRIPFTQKIFANVNRLTLDAKLGFDRRISSLNFERDNTDTYTAESTGEWEISKNFRLSFGGKLGLINNRARSEDGYMTVEVNSQLVIQF